MSVRITERTLYKPVGEVLRRFGVSSVSEVSIEGESFPDLIAEINGHKFLIEVRIDTESKLLEVIPQALNKATKAHIPGMIASLLFPNEVREISPDILDEVAPKLKIKRAIISTSWIAGSWREILLEDFARQISDSYRAYTKTLLPTVSYDAIVDAAREAVIDVASAIRRSLITQYLNDAMAIVARFDIYRATLKEFKVEEEEMKAYIADIAAYLIVNQILFYHILSQKTGKYPQLPDVSPLLADMNLIAELKERFSLVAKDYQPVFGLDLLTIISKTGGINSARAIARFIATLKALKPEHVKAELLGRLYQESIPPETRKNLGAFFTKPRAAAILATLAIDKWDEKVLDPACGSGTLLTEAYKRKKALAPHVINEEELHKELLSQIYGIDIMHFAHHMTSINLLALNLTTPVKLENIKAGDGLGPMIKSVSCKADDPPSIMRLDEWLESIRPPESLTRETFDVIIMNPPFTRHERLSEIGEIERLKKLFHGDLKGEIVRGKVGYWAYFVAAADNVLKQNGKLAMVTPEEFFAGGGAESLRRFLFLGQAYKEGKYLLIEDNPIYSVEYVIRSGREVAFSEAALYRDYLVVFKKEKALKEKPMLFIILTKPLNEIEPEEVARKIKEFSNNSLNSISFEDFEAIKLSNVKKFINKHISNLKPLVGFNTLEAQAIFLELIDMLSSLPTLRELEEQEIIKMRYYNPGQYLQEARGAERETRMLFATKYFASGEWLFKVSAENSKTIKFEVKKSELTFDLPKSATVTSLRTYSGVKHLDITTEEEYAIVEPEKIPVHIRKATGLINIKSLKIAAKDIKKAFTDIAGNILLLRKLQVPSPNIYWMAFFSDNKTLGTTDRINVRINDSQIFKPLVLYLNSSISFLQLLGFHSETRGAWIRIDKDGAWSEIHIPEFNALSPEIRNEVNTVFRKIHKIDVEPLFNRLKNKSSIQKLIDEVSLDMLGLENWKNNINQLYDAIAGELQLMQEILEKSKKPSKKKIKARKEDDSIRQLSLDGDFR